MVPITHVFPVSAARLPLLYSAYDAFAMCGHKEVVLQCGHLEDMMADPTKIKVYQKALADTGMVFCDSHSPFGVEEDLACPFEDVRPVMIERKKLSMKIAASFGIDSITIHVGNAIHKWCTLEQYRSNLFDSLDKLLPLAEELKIAIAIENIWFANNTAKDLLAAMEKFPSDYLGICYDSGHANITSGKFTEPTNVMVRAYADYGAGEPVWNSHLLEDVLPYVTTCHIHDNNAIWDQHLLPGYGNIDWSHIVPLLKTAPRLKCIQNESAPSELYPVSIARTVETFRKLFA